MNLYFFVQSSVFFRYLGVPGHAIRLQAVEQIASQFDVHADALDGLLADLGIE